MNRNVGSNRKIHGFGERELYFASAYDLKVVNTFFRKRDILYNSRGIILCGGDFKTM